MKGYLKKTISMVLLLCAILSALLSCERAFDVDDSHSAKELADAIMAAYGPDDLPDTGLEHFYSGADEDSEYYFDAKYAGMVIDGAYAELEEFEYFSDCAFYTPVGKRIFEVDVLKVSPGEEENIGKLKDALERRLATKIKSDTLVYTPKDAPLLDNAKIMTLGCYVILLATNDNGKAEKVIDDMVKIYK